ncbi:peptidase S9, prolyl oligopeptidase active site region [Candidatus Koribacter versatilis Ellin345]|uniref:Peptidase S9, prolyl oligopeptidase active site region n=1 Tax=Koribacter versatilis (strain Ellin345) TaxID=204669 RepID=Q1IIV7_KORVE|nr:S9 family peptidase [Candidatus Koribacter versatilis]ABF43193.1 peptidase S9, prolyl oligopeptidase active site region [Candidatus Koribacter versatilis Ellin345]
MVRRFLVALLLLSSFAVAQSKRAFTFDDMMKLKRVAEPYLSPDGKWAAFTVTDVSLETNKKTNHIWIVPVAGGEARQLTNYSGEDNFRFSPDGKSALAITDAEGSSQVYVQDFDTTTGTLTGDPRKVTSISTEVSAATWSPDGRSILFVSAVWPDCKDDACNKQRDDERSQSKVKAQIFTHLLYRHWNAYGNGKRSHLFIQSLEGGEPLDLTPGDHDVPPFSLGGQDQYSFSPDGKEIAYASNLDEVEATSTNTDIFVVPVTGGTPKKISTSPGADSTPLYSPDGKYIAFRSQARAGYESDRFRLMLYERATGKTTELTQGFDGWVESIVWHPNSRGLFFTSELKGEAPVYWVELQGHPIELWAGFNDGCQVTPAGTFLVCDVMSIKAPNEIQTIKISNLKEITHKPEGGGSIDQITHINAPILDQVQMQPIEPFWFTGAEGVKVQGFLVKPPNFDASKKYPVKFLIHGGPQGAWGDDWSFRWNPELFAANGYLVIMVNPRGSTGYGQKFIDDINGDWGGRAYQDLMLGLDYAEKNFANVDKDRECALGASYGGYMANWLEGHTTRFKCIVSHDGMFNTVSAFGTTEELWFNNWEFKGTPWTNPEMYKKWSPNQSVANFKTPMLVVHGQLDYRLDVSEGFQLFTYLQLQKVPSKMLYFPDEGHWVLKPQNSQLWYKTVNDWVDQWTKK